MKHPDTTPDVRLVPLTDQHIHDIRHGDEKQILNAIAYIIRAYDTAPPMTSTTAIVYMTDLHQWKQLISDLDNAA